MNGPHVLRQVRRRVREAILGAVRGLLPDADALPARVVLFGSLARGDWDGRSDVDLAVIFPDEAARRRGEPALTRLFGRLAEGHPLDIVALTETELARSGLREAILSGEVLRDGPQPGRA